MHNSVPSDEWNVLYEAKDSAPRYPHDAVVRWVFVNYREEFIRNPKMLDIGCGAGRHSIFLANLGCNVSALDYSSNAIEILDSWAKEEKLKIDTKVISAIKLPYSENSFVAILSIGVLCYLNFPEIKRSVQEMYRILKPGGKLLVVTRSDKDSRYVTSKVSTKRHSVVAGDKTVPWQVEIGMNMTFLNQDDINEIFHEFKFLNIEKETFTMCNRKYINDDWIITAIK